MTKISKLLLCLTLLSDLSKMHAFMMPLRLSSRPMNIQMIDNIDRRDILKKAVVSYSFLSAMQKMKPADAYNLDEISQIALYEKAVPSVCYISTEYKNIASKFPALNASKSLPKGVGTGFVWDNEGHIVTNFHVINKVDNAIINFGDKQEYVAKLTGADPDRDIAVLKISNKTLPPMPRASNKDIRTGQYAFAIGNPFGQEFTFTTGVVSGMHREITAPSGRKIRDIIQTDAAINPGNSGGPLLDSSGKLIGMNTATYGMGVSSGVNFAVSVDTIKETVKELIVYGFVQRAVLGISFLDKPSNSTLSNSTGITVLEVPITSPCYKAGLQAGDIITAMDKNKIAVGNDLLRTLETYKPGDKVKLHILRGNEKVPLSVDVVLGSFKVKTYSGLEYEELPKNTLTPNIPIIPLDIPLKDMAPKLKP